jgi:hypothetical protein
MINEQSLLDAAERLKKAGATPLNLDDDMFYVVECNSNQAARIAAIIAKSKRPINLLIRVEPGSEVTL